MQYLKLNRLMVFIIIITLIQTTTCNSKNNDKEIVLSKITLRNVAGRYPDVFLNADFIVLHKIGGGEDKLYYYERKGFKKQKEIDLFELGYKGPSFLSLSDDNTVYLISRARKNDKLRFPELVKIDFQGKIELKKRLKFIPRGLTTAGSEIYIVGKYMNKALHVFDNKGNYKKSFISLEKLTLSNFPWRLIVKKYNNQIFISDVKKYKIWILKNRKIFKVIKFRIDKELIEKKELRNKNRIYRNKGIHDFIVKNNNIYVSCFDHTNKKNKTWYDIIDIKKGKITETFNTNFLYYIADYKGKIMIYHNLPRFELFNIYFK